MTTTPLDLQTDLMENFADILKRELEKVYCRCTRGDNDEHYQVMFKEDKDCCDWEDEHYGDWLCNFCARSYCKELIQRVKDDELECAALKVTDKDGNIVHELAGPTIQSTRSGGGKKHRSIMRPVSFNYNDGDDFHICESGASGESE